MDSLGRILAAFFFSLLVHQCRAGHAFNWGFSPNSIQTQFTECSKTTINVIPLNSSTTYLGEPPYAMMAYAVSGTTIVSSLGDDPTNLLWQVQHPENSSLLLTVVDSIGQTGGFTSHFIDVTAGADTSCQVQTPSNHATVTPNVTTSINTCEPWGLAITGGVKPYTISLAALGAPVVTNVTMDPDDDFFTFIDRANPNTQILAAVVDATGQWGISSPAVKTAGSDDTSCVGLVSSDSSQTLAQSEAAGAPPKGPTTNTTAIALGLVFGLLVPLILVGIGFWWWRRRKRLMSPIMVGGPDSKPRPYDPGMQERALGRPSLNLDTNVMRVDSQTRRSPSWVVDIHQVSTGPTNDSPTSTDMLSTELRQNTVPTPFLTPPQVVQSSSWQAMRSPQSMLPPSALTRTISATQVPGPASPPEPMPTMMLVTTPNSTSPAATLSPAQRYRKALEAHAEAQAARARMTSASASASGSGSGFGSAPSSATTTMFATGTPVVRSLPQRSQSAIPRTSRQPPVPRRAGSSLRLPPVAAIPRVGPNIIIQHRDGGIIEELPPPYPMDARYPAPRTPPFSPLPPLPLVRGEAGPPA